MRYGTFRKLVGVDRGVDMAALGAMRKWLGPVKVPPRERNCLECVN
jgi:hypothetical protein